MTIRDYSEYQVEDFVEDEHFRKWVQEQDASLDFFWRAFLNEYPSKSKTIEEARQILCVTFDFFAHDVAGIENSDDGFTTSMKDIFLESKESSVPEEKHRIWKSKRLVAAIILLLLTIGCSYLYFIGSEDRIEYATGNGQWETIFLPDGSEVALNANSQLSLLNKWKEGEDRTVWLKGEAFFKVEKKKSTNAKFTVVTKDLKVEVFGTAFNVNTRNRQTEVFLEEGEITLALDDKKEQIKPGEYIAYSQEKKQIVDRYKKTQELHSNWKAGILKIDNASIRDILDEIEMIYGIDVIVRNKEALKVRGSIAIPVDDLDMATSILERLLNVKVDKKGKQLFIN